MKKKKDIIKEFIDSVGISEAGLARLINYTKANVHYHLNKEDDIENELYDLIIDKFKEKGITINGGISQTISGGSGSTATEGDMHGVLIGDQKEVHYHSQITETIIKELTQPYKDQIDLLKHLLEQKEKELTELKNKTS